MKADPTIILLIAILVVVIAILLRYAEREDARHFADIECAHSVVAETRGAMTLREAHSWCVGDL